MLFCCSFAPYQAQRHRRPGTDGLELLSREELDRVYEEERIHLIWNLILQVNGSRRNNFQLELIMSAEEFEKQKTFYILPHPSAYKNLYQH